MQVLMALFLYFLIVFFANMLEELTPIYASAPVRQGGLGLPLNLLAWPLTAAGGVLVVFTLYGYPAFQVRFPELHRTASMLHPHVTLGRGRGGGGLGVGFQVVM